HLDAFARQQRGRASGREQLDPEGRKTAGELDDAGLVGNGEQGTSDGHARLHTTGAVASDRQAATRAPDFRGGAPMPRKRARTSYPPSSGAMRRGPSSAMTRSLVSPRVSSCRTRSRVRFMMTPTSSSVMPPR